jgi:hypothetical protein
VQPRRTSTLIRLACLAGATLAVSGCAQIWNAGDLIEWVKDQAVKQGCSRDSIELEDWYRTEASGNVWHGTCRHRDDGRDLSFAIDVDPVWKPSASRS